MICNEVYRGVIVWNRIGKIRNPQTGRKVLRVNPRGEWREWQRSRHRVGGASAGDDRTPRQGEKRELRLEGRAVSSHTGGPPALSSARLKHRLGWLAARQADGAVLPLDRVGGLHE
jgi:hypothetical protein